MTCGGKSDVDRAIASFVKDLMARMDLRDKVGEMTQLDISVLAGGPEFKRKDRSAPIVLDKAKLQSLLVERRVGSILNGVDGQLSLEQWHSVLEQVQAAASLKATKIPILYGIDSIHGANYVTLATLFPHQLAIAASWNLPLAEKIAHASAYETRAAGIRWTFSPVLDVGRNPVWPRLYETFGEDTYVCSQVGLAFVRGYQGSTSQSSPSSETSAEPSARAEAAAEASSTSRAADGAHVRMCTLAPDRLGACLKHFVGYSDPKSGMDRTPNWIPERFLREYFLPSFERSVAEGALSIMVCSSDVNGIPVHANKALLTDYLRGELGFDGVVVSDWSDVFHLWYMHGIAKDKKDAIRLAVNAGVDLAMAALMEEHAQLLEEVVEEGGISMSRVDEAVQRILTFKCRLGLFDDAHWTSGHVSRRHTDNTAGTGSGTVLLTSESERDKGPTVGQAPPDGPSDPVRRPGSGSGSESECRYERFGGEEHRQLSLDCAREAVTLLRNENGVLPLCKGSRVLVTGPTADYVNALNGGWSHMWQGTWEGEDLNTPGSLSFLKAVKEKIGKDHVTFHPGCKFSETLDVQDLVSSISSTRFDAALVCLGEDSYTEMFGSIPDLDLPSPQLDLVHTIAKAAQSAGHALPIVLVLLQGRPRVIRPIVEACAAVVMGYLPGDQGGRALADVIFGDVNPSGLLPITYPKFSNSLVIYDHRRTEHIGVKPGIAYDPQWPFGTGLSYSEFTYSDLKVSRAVIGPRDTVTISVRVLNAGKLPGKHVVLLYITDDVASVVPSMRRLRGFQKVGPLGPAEGVLAEFHVSAQELAFVGVDCDWVVEDGTFTVQVGELTGTFSFKDHGDGQGIPREPPRRLV